MNIGEEEEPIELPMPVDPATIPIEQPVREPAPLQVPVPVPAEPVRQPARQAKHAESFQDWIDAGIIDGMYTYGDDGKTFFIEHKAESDG